jgi:hypothetical protein
MPNDMPAPSAVQYSKAPYTANGGGSPRPTPVVAAERATPAALRASLDRDYCNDDYPVVSFLFALYCDAEFSAIANQRFIESEGKWDRYLDKYRKNIRRSFPPGAARVIHVEVPSNDQQPLGSGRYVPTREQCTAFIKDFLVPELALIPVAQANQPPADLPLDPAFPNATRPVLSSLALIFLNRSRQAQLDDVLQTRGVSPAARAVLERVQWTAEGRPYMTEKDVNDLEPALTDDMTRLPSMW